MDRQSTKNRNDEKTDSFSFLVFELLKGFNFEGKTSGTMLHTIYEGPMQFLVCTRTFTDCVLFFARGTESEISKKGEQDG